MSKHGVSNEIRALITEYVQELIDGLEEMFPEICTECLHIAITQETIHLGSERYLHKKDETHAK